MGSTELTPSWMTLSGSGGDLRRVCARHHHRRRDRRLDHGEQLDPCVGALRQGFGPSQGDLGFRGAVVADGDVPERLVLVLRVAFRRHGDVRRRAVEKALRDAAEQHRPKTPRWGEPTTIASKSSRSASMVRIPAGEPPPYARVSTAMPASASRACSKNGSASVASSALSSAYSIGSGPPKRDGDHECARVGSGAAGPGRARARRGRRCGRRARPAGACPRLPSSQTRASATWRHR